jgi:hypothetical protein
MLFIRHTCKFIKTSDEFELKEQNGNTDAKKQEGLQNFLFPHTKEIADYLKQKDFSKR